MKISLNPTSPLSKNIYQLGLTTFINLHRLTQLILFGSYLKKEDLSVAYYFQKDVISLYCHVFLQIYFYQMIEYKIVQIESLLSNKNTFSTLYDKIKHKYQQYLYKNALNELDKDLETYLVDKNNGEIRLNDYKTILHMIIDDKCNISSDQQQQQQQQQ